MVETLTKIIPFVVPPLLGALIGYVTNAIAIRMLFRPLTEKRIFGLRVPLTPGIIPRQRFQLAESIGRMVSTQLLTPDTVRSHIASEGFRTGVREQVAGFTARLLDSTPGGAGSTDIHVVNEGFRSAISGLFSGFLRSDGFERVTVEFVRRGFEFLSTLSIEDILPRGMREESGSLDAINSLVDRVLGTPLAESLVEAGTSWVREQIANDTPVREMLSDEMIARTTLALSRAYEPLARYAIGWLESSDVRADLTVRGKTLLKSVLERLNFFQRLLVSAGQYDRTLSERMPVIIDDLISSIRESLSSVETRARILDGVSGWLQKLQQRGLHDVVTEAGIDLEQIAKRAFGSVAGLLVGPEGRRRIATTLNGYLRSHLQTRVVDVLADVFLLDSNKVEQWISENLRRLRERPSASSSASSLIASLAATLLDELRSHPLREMLLLTSEQKAAVDDFITDRISGIIDDKLPDIVETFDVHRMVVDKINGLDIEAVEGLLLMVIARQLKWINLFGAILGALIGGGQVVVGLFT